MRACLWEKGGGEGGARNITFRPPWSSSSTVLEPLILNVFLIVICRPKVWGLKASMPVFLRS